MTDTPRPRTPEELARAVVRLLGLRRVLRVVGLAPVAPPEGHGYYVFVVVRGDAPDARRTEEEMLERWAPRRPRVDFWVMGEEEWERAHRRVGHPARAAHLDGTVLYEAEAAGGAADVA